MKLCKIALRFSSTAFFSRSFIPMISRKIMGVKTSVIPLAMISLLINVGYGTCVDCDVGNDGNAATEEEEEMGAFILQLRLRRMAESMTTTLLVFFGIAVAKFGLSLILILTLLLLLLLSLLNITGASSVVTCASILIRNTKEML